MERMAYEMKKTLLWFLTFCLCLSLAVAGAETEVATQEITARNLELNKSANTLMMQTEDRKYQVIDAQGNPLSETYGDMSIRSGFYRVANEEGVNKMGLLDGQGQLIIPMEYGDIEVISDRWQAAVTLKEATSENYDYKSFLGSGFYLIDQVDMYYRGVKKASLSRMDWSSAWAYGDYIRIQNRDRVSTFYNKEMQPSPRPSEYSSEYDEDYRTGAVWHQGSGQEAFTAGCTLTPDEVDQSLWIKKAKVLDLQGNVVGDVANYADAYTPKGSYIRVRNGAGLYGVADKTGKEILPCIYDYMESDLEAAEAVGYVYAGKDGKGGYVNLTTGREAGFEFSRDALRDYAAFAMISDLDGSILVVSAAAGQLPAKYKDFRAAYSDVSVSCPLALVQDAEDRAGVIGLLGEEIVPLDGTYDDTYDLDISNDGSLILGRKDYGSYVLYRVSYDPDLSAFQAPAGEAEADGSWTCVNGHAGNTGKFCTECGSPKPEESSEWTCVNGHAGNTGKFCSECGAPKP